MFLKAIVKDPKSIVLPFKNHTALEEPNIITTPTLENVSIQTHKSLFDNPLNEKIEKLERQIAEITSVTAPSDALLPKLHNNILKKAINLNKQRKNPGKRKVMVSTDTSARNFKKIKPQKQSKIVKKKGKTMKKSDRIYQKVLENIKDLYREED